MKEISRQNRTFQNEDIRAVVETRDHGLWKKSARTHSYAGSRTDLRPKIERFFWRDFSGEEFLPRTAFSGKKCRSILSNQVISLYGSRAVGCPNRIMSVYGFSRTVVPHLLQKIVDWHHWWPTTSYCLWPPLSPGFPLLIVNYDRRSPVGPCLRDRFSIRVERVGVAPSA